MTCVILKGQGFPCEVCRAEGKPIVKCYAEPGHVVTSSDQGTQFFCEEHCPKHQVKQEELKLVEGVG